MEASNIPRRPRQPRKPTQPLSRSITTSFSPSTSPRQPSTEPITSRGPDQRKRTQAAAQLLGNRSSTTRYRLTSPINELRTLDAEIARLRMSSGSADRDRLLQLARRRTQLNNDLDTTYGEEGKKYLVKRHQDLTNSPSQPSTRSEFTPARQSTNSSEARRKTGSTRYTEAAQPQITEQQRINLHKATQEIVALSDTPYAIDLRDRLSRLMTLEERKSRLENLMSRSNDPYLREELSAISRKISESNGKLQHEFGRHGVLSLKLAYEHSAFKTKTNAEHEKRPPVTPSPEGDELSAVKTQTPSLWERAKRIFIRT